MLSLTALILVHQAIVLQLAMKSQRILDTLMLSCDILSNFILYYVACMNSVHYHTEIACSLSRFPMPTLYPYLWARESLECSLTF